MYDVKCGYVMMLIDFLPDSDCMYLEDCTVWFVSRLDNILFKMNIKSGEYEYVKALSEHGPDKWRFHPVCVKHENNVYCLPDRGGGIWIYNLLRDNFEQIKLDNPNSVRIRMKYLAKYKERLFTVSLGLKQIIVINLRKQEIEYIYTLSNNGDEDLSDNNLMVGTVIYGILNSSKTILYEFNVISQKVKKTIISNKRTFYNTISFDGDKFWLSGTEKEILVWNAKKGIIEYVNGFINYLHILNFKKNCVESVSDLAEIYEPLFTKSLFLSGKIWFIPFRTDKVIYINKNTHEVGELLLPLEKEDKTSIRARGGLCNYKFFLEYVIADRYLIIYSLKMECHYIIDTLSMNVEKRLSKFLLNKSEDLAEVYKKKKFFLESEVSDRIRYRVSYMWGKKRINMHTNEIGRLIYRNIVELD